MGEMSNTLYRETLHSSNLDFPQGQHFSRLEFHKIGFSSKKAFLKDGIFLKAGTLKSASLFDAVAHTDAVAQISCEGERWILRLKGSNGCKSLCR